VGRRFLEYVTTEVLLEAAPTPAVAATEPLGLEFLTTPVPAEPAPDVRIGWFDATYRESLRQLADLVGERAQVAPGELLAAWEATTDQRMLVVLRALGELGDPYVWASDGPDGFDCSGLTRFAWSAHDIELPHLSVAQANAGEAVTPETMQPGDLVHAPGHIMLWLGARDAVVESTGGGVQIGRYGTRAADAFTNPLLPRRAGWSVPDGVQRTADGRIVDTDAASPGESVPPAPLVEDAVVPAPPMAADLAAPVAVADPGGAPAVPVLPASSEGAVVVLPAA
jgi:hypothetical protein